MYLTDHYNRIISTKGPELLSNRPELALALKRKPTEPRSLSYGLGEEQPETPDMAGRLAGSVR
jgi:hypothetical protein